VQSRVISNKLAKEYEILIKTARPKETRRIRRELSKRFQDA
jgi:hypothetical protein